MTSEFSAYHLQIFLTSVNSYREESSAARRLVAEALRQYLGSAPSAEDLAGETRPKGGKPFFPDYPDFQYSISHSEGLVVCGTVRDAGGTVRDAGNELRSADAELRGADDAVRDAGGTSRDAGGTNRDAGKALPIGIDIQKIPQDAKKALKIADHFFSEGERSALHALAAAEDSAPLCKLFCRFWTARESYIKLTGRGLAEPFKNFFPDLDSHRIIAAEGNCQMIYLTECPAPEGYCITVCSYVPLQPVECVRM